MAYSFDDASAADRHTTQYFEMFCNRGIYHDGWTAVTQPQHPVDGDRDARIRRRRLGALRPGRLDAGPRPRSRAAREARRAPTAVPDRGPRSTTCCPSTTAASSASIPISRAGRSSSGQLPAPLRQHGTPDRELDRRAQESLALDHGRDPVPEGGANGVVISQGGAFGGFAALREGRKAGLLLQPLRAAAVQGLR